MLWRAAKHVLEGPKNMKNSNRFPKQHVIHLQQPVNYRAHRSGTSISHSSHRLTDGYRRIFRGGFTLLELLVVISIIAMLMSLILPAIQTARKSARRIECLNHMHNLAIAMTARTEAHRRYPAAGYWAGQPGNRYPSHNWCVDLLPYVDRLDLADRWNYDVGYSDAPNGQLSMTQVSVFVCPEDDSVQGAGDLSYAVSGGIGYSTFLNNVHDVPVDPFGNAIDLNGNGVIGLSGDPLDGSPTDRQLLRHLGLFFMENFGPHPGVVRHHTTASVRDGFSNTLMFLENSRTGRNSAEPDENWATPYAHKSAVFFGPNVCDANICQTGHVDYSKANSGQWKINAGLNELEGRSPFAASNHPGGVNVAFADGSARFLSREISGHVYAALFSPVSVSLIGLPLEQAVPSANEF